MTILTRENLDDGTYRTRLGLPEHLAWTEAQIDASFAQAWALRAAGPVRVFAYGSLMWNPLLACDAEEKATLDGWQRSFCLRSISGRGSAERPGRVLSLQPGGQVQGVTLRFDDEVQAARELRLLWSREMSSGAYRPQWVDVSLQDGSRASALAFFGNPGHWQHEADECVETVAGIVAVATGRFGPNVEYVHALARALRERGLHDAYVEAVVRALEAAPRGAQAK
ncbi:MAG TPA: gamma-glutamylcyclotransferase [Burkholderiaceae bacterium]|nr:gamma-glutamylcyclotransferase [Burkholderiaceae bacterium]